MEDVINKVREPRNSNLGRHHRLKIIAILAIILCFGELFFYSRNLSSLKQDVIKFKENVEEDNEKIITALDFDKPIPIIKNESNSLDSKKKLVPQDIIHLDMETIKKYSLKNVKSIDIKPHTEIAFIKDISKKELVHSKNIHAFYYIISKNSTPVRIIENLCYAKPEIPGKNTKSNNIENKITTINELIITTIDNRQYKSPFTIDKFSNDSVESPWKVVLCDDDDLDQTTVYRIKSALKEQNYDVPVSDKWDEIKSVLYKYQRDHILPVGYLDLETLKKLGFEVFIGNTSS